MAIIDLNSLLNPRYADSAVREKKAAAEAPAAPTPHYQDAGQKLLDAALELTKQASAPAPVDASDAMFDALVKMASDAVKLEDHALMAQAKLGGAALADAFMARAKTATVASSVMNYATSPHVLGGAAGGALVGGGLAGDEHRGRGALVGGLAGAGLGAASHALTPKVLKSVQEGELESLLKKQIEGAPAAADAAAKPVQNASASHLDALRADPLDTRRGPALLRVEETHPQLVDAVMGSRDAPLYAAGNEQAAAAAQRAAMVPYLGAGLAAAGGGALGAGVSQNAASKPSPEKKAAFMPTALEHAALGGGVGALGGGVTGAIAGGEDNRLRGALIGAGVGGAAGAVGGGLLGPRATNLGAGMGLMKEDPAALEALARIQAGVARGANDPSRLSDFGTSLKGLKHLPTQQKIEEGLLYGAGTLGAGATLGGLAGAAAAPDPQAFTAEDVKQAYVLGMQAYEKQAQDEYQAGLRQAHEETHKVAAEAHYLGQISAANVLAALTARGAQ